MYTPVNSSLLQFYYIKVGFKGVNIILAIVEFYCIIVLELIINNDQKRRVE